MVGHPTLASATCSEGEAPAPPPQQLIPAHIVADKTTARPIRAECLNISLPVYRPSFLSRLTASTRPTSRQAIARLSRPTAPDPVPGLQRLAFSAPAPAARIGVLTLPGIGTRSLHKRRGQERVEWPRRSRRPGAKSVQCRSLFEPRRRMETDGDARTGPEAGSQRWGCPCQGQPAFDGPRHWGPLRWTSQRAPYIRSGGVFRHCLLRAAIRGS